MLLLVNDCQKSYGTMFGLMVSKRIIMSEMMNTGVELMLIGMGIVFAFLALLIVIVNIMTAVIQRFFPEAPITAVPLSASTSYTDASVIVAISAAVHQYRGRYKQ